MIFINTLNDLEKSPMSIFLGHQEVLPLLLFLNHLLFHRCTVIILSMGTKYMIELNVFYSIDLICLDVVCMWDRLNQRVNRVTVNSNVRKQVRNMNSYVKIRDFHFCNYSTTRQKFSLSEYWMIYVQ